MSNEDLNTVITPDKTVLRKSRFAKNLQEPAEDLPLGATFDDFFYLSEIVEKKMKQNKPYWCLKLTDKTGVIDARVFDKPKDLSTMPGSGVYIKVRAETNKFNEQVQLIVRLLRPLDPRVETIAVEDFVPVGPHDRYKRIEEFRADIARRVKNPGYRTLMLSFFEDFDLYQGLRDCPGAKSKHQAYIGGLLDHVMQIYRLVYAVWEAYDQTFDADVMAAAALLHDAGKIFELRYDVGIDMMVRGKLVGHVADSLIVLNALSPNYWKGWERQKEAEDRARLLAKEIDEPDPGEYVPPSYAQLRSGIEHLEHIIASHHGNKEWGAMRVPATREAWFFHLLDMIDARAGLFDVLELEPTDVEGFTSFKNDIGSRVWNPKKREYPSV